MNWAAVLDGPGLGKPPYQTISNAVRVLEHDPAWSVSRLWFDEFAGRIMFQNSPLREWRDDDDVALTVYMQDMTGMPKIQKAFVCDAVDLVCRRRGRHAVREYLSSLAWDGIARIDHALEDLWGVDCAEGQPSDYVRAVSRNLLIGLVARVMRPGCKLDTMVVFEGPQGTLKSSALDVLGGEWYAAIDESAATKDFLQVLRGKWVIELCEMNAVSKAESAHVKGILSRRIDTYRASFGRRSADVPRQCVFAGTTNRTDWSTDDTGDRRFWPIRCGVINLEAIAASRDQLFAEALVRLADGATWWQMPALTREVQAERLPDHAWTSLILDGLAGYAETTMAEVLQRILKFSPDKITINAERQVGSILRRSGWVSKPARRNGLRRVWFAPDSSDDTFKA